MYQRNVCCFKNFSRNPARIIRRKLHRVLLLLFSFEKLGNFLKNKFFFLSFVKLSSYIFFQVTLGNFQRKLSTDANPLNNDALRFYKPDVYSHDASYRARAITVTLYVENKGRASILLRYFAGIMRV